MGSVVFSEKLSSIKPYEVDKTRYSVKLDANESYLPFPEALQEEVVKMVKSFDFNRYPDAEAEEVRSLYADYCGVDLEKVLAGNGSDELIQIIINAFVGRDDKILTVKPDFSMYKFYTSIMEGRVVEVETDDDFRLDVDKFIEAAQEEKVRVIIFSNPCNPTGTVLPKSDILRIIENTNALVVVDEAYYEFYGETLIDCIDKYENLAVLRTSSKAMGLASLRLGFLIGNEKLINNIKKVKPPYNINGLTQAVGALVLKNTGIVKENVARIIMEREYLLEGLSELEKACSAEKFKIIPTSSNFVYIKSSISEEIYKGLLKEDIVIRYYNSGAIRVTVGSREENALLLAGLKKVLFN